MTITSVLTGLTGLTGMFPFDASGCAFEDPQRRIPPWRSHDAAAGVRCRAAHPEISDRRPVLRPSGHRPREEQLVQGQLALKDVAFGQPPLALEIERRHDLSMQ